MFDLDDFNSEDTLLPSERGLAFDDLADGQEDILEPEGRPVQPSAVSRALRGGR